MKLMIGIPVLDNVNHMFFLHTAALIGKMSRVHEIELMCPNRCAIDRARQFIVEAAIAKECDRLLFIDDDTLVPIETTVPVLEELLGNHENAIAASGFCYQRGYKYLPMVYRYEDLEWGKGNAQLIAPWPEEPFQVNAVGMGICLLDVKKLKVVEEKLKPCFSREGLGTEDFYFFEKAHKCGFETWLTPKLEASHIGDSQIVNSSNADTLRSQTHAVMVQFMEAESGGRSTVKEVGI